MVIGRLKRVPRLLIALPQFPWDPASGAARTANSVGELLSDAGFAVQVIGTTATEGYLPLSAIALEEKHFMRTAGLLRLKRRGVTYQLVDIFDASLGAWPKQHGATYDALFDRILKGFCPDFVLTYGGSLDDVARHHRAKAFGAQVIFGLYNVRYCTRGIFEHLDAIVTPSEFLTRFYLDNIGLRSTPLPTPLSPEDVLASDRDPRCLTIVNPSLDKGLMLFASLAAALGARYPEIPIEVYPSRESPHFLMQAALVAGIDLAAHPNLTIHSTVPTPSAIYRRARVVLVPSLVEDAAPRVVAEALVNGVPPIGSDRGGIPEMCAGGGYVLPLPRSLDSRSLNAVAPKVVQPWIELVALLFGKQDVWRKASARARVVGERYLPPNVTGSYVDFFERLVASGQGGRS